MTTSASTTSVGQTTTPYEGLIGLAREAALLGSTASLLNWDQQTMMPPGGLAYRSRQLACLASLRHGVMTDPRLGEHLAGCESDQALMADPTGPAAVNVRELRRLHDRQRKLPRSLVEELARTTSLAQHEWAEARRDSDFARFRPLLEEVVALLRHKAQCLGWPADGEPWDALAEDYEPGCTAAAVEAIFGPLRERLQGLLGELMAGSTRPSDALNELKLPIEKQQKFVRFVAAQIGFDFSRGRLDCSAHPFCSGTHCNDVRMTTRFQQTMVCEALGSTMHETGHGIYEQGLPAENIGTPMGESVSLGIHESQSRMWENQVGRSRAFWSWCHPKLAEFFGAAVESLSLDDVYGGANIVRPGFIRVEADEVTYNLHVMARFDIERVLIRGDLKVSEIPGAWNDAYREYLGLEVPDDRRGCLQDIHWSSGSIGYFPTYTLGNLYAAQLFDKAAADIDGLFEQFARGEFAALKAWLNEHIHSQGQRYRAADLCRHVTGKPLSAEPLMRYLEGKLRPLYGQ